MLIASKQITVESFLFCFGLSPVGVWFSCWCGIHTLLGARGIGQAAPGNWGNSYKGCFYLMSFWIEVSLLFVGGVH